MPTAPLYILDSAQGLASNQVHRLARDAKARILMATPVGLMRYDGSFIREWNRQNGLRCNGLRCVAIDAAQTIWIGSDIGLECISADGHAEPTLDSAIWRFGLCQHIAFCLDGAWVGTAHGLVKLERRDDKNGYRVAFVADVGFVNDVVFINDNRILAASAKEGLIETDGRTWWRYRNAALRNCRVTRVALAPDGALLVGTDDGLFVIDDGSNAVLAHMVAPHNGGAHFDPTVTAVSADKEHYWVAFGRVLMAYKASIEGEEINEHLIVESVVNDVLLDTLGNAFIATNCSGLAKVSCLRNAVKRIDLGILGGVYCIKPTAENTHTIGGEHLFGAVEITDDGSAIALGWPNGVPDTVVWDSLRDADGMWLATQAGLFFGSHGNDNVPVFFRQMFDTDATLAAPNRVLIQRGAELWAGSLRGLARIHNGWCTPVTADGASLGYVYAMHVDADSALWVCTLGRGLWREKNGLRYVGNKLLSPDGNTYAVASDASGRMIILQDEKVVLMAPDLSARLVTKLLPVAGWTAAWINATTVAIGASDGLRIIDVDTGEVLRHIQSLFRLRDWEFTNNRTLVADQQGRLLCGLNGGLVRVDVAALARFEPPVCKLLDIVWTGESPPQKDGIFLPNRGKWSVRVRVFCAWFVESSRLRYQFQLIGFDNDWSAPQTRAEVTFNTLPPGEYRLRCRAYSPLTGQGAEVQVLHILVRRPMWALGWTAVLAHLENVYDKQVRSRKRNQLLIEENKTLESAVADRTRLLLAANHELEAVRDAYKQLSEVDELTGMGNRRNFEKELARFMALTTRLQMPLALLIVDVDFFKGVNDTYGHQVGDTYLRTIGTTLLGAIRTGEDVATRFGGEEFAIILVNTTASGAMQNAERIRLAVAALQLKNESCASGYITVSIGVAIFPSVGAQGTAVDRETLITLADQALYQAKNSGRNKAILATRNTN